MSGERGAGQVERNLGRKVVEGRLERGEWSMECEEWNMEKGVWSGNWSGKLTVESGECRVGSGESWSCVPPILSCGTRFI